MTGLVVWADDLTGAAEVAAMLGLAVATGLPAAVAPAASDGVVQDLDLRHLSAADARRRLGALVRRTPADAPIRLKTDSQMNGPVAAYLQAMLDGGRRPVLCVASPTTGRSTADGVHVVPSPGGALRIDLRHALSGFPLRILGAGNPLGDLEDGVAVVADAAGTGDLERIAAQTDALGGTRVGSAAFLGAGGTRADPPPQAPGSCAAMLVVVGSLEPIARTQVQALVADRPGIPVIDCGPDALDAVDTARRGLAEHGLAVLVGRPRLADTLARTAAAVLADLDPPPWLLLTGGHTARTVLGQLDVGTLRPVAAPVPGVVALTTADDRCVLTKPGSYGSATTLRDLARALLSTPEEIR